ncbi:MAG: CRISPR-associated endonuclease Cas3'' [Planctomycetes bacterium]|nr:CRISPR-associated endonuclease Cas3'' [Planctomycetota bacterium]
MSSKSESPPPFFARWSEDRRKAQLLKCHLKRVSARAEAAARVIRSDDVPFQTSAKLEGLLHDLGKYRVEFQEYLNAGDRGRRSSETAHAVYGAAAAGVDWDALAVAFAIAGHHAGLHDQDKLASQIDGHKFHAMDRFPKLLKQADGTDELAGVLQTLRPRNEDASDSLARLDFEEGNPADVRRFEVFVRMLFSVLVDADRLDSEKFEQEHRRKRSWERPNRTLDAAALLARLDKARRVRTVEMRESRPDLNQLRQEVFEACIERARAPSLGFFSLTVPTGGGKTYSSMAFALEHARTHDLRRVIVVIPYLSIIEQNARDYRTIFGADQVLEHHCAVELASSKPRSSDTDDEPSQMLDYERAIENWDVPIVVTTSVQFIESLFAAATARARKVHNIARSVVIFDEVQTLPTHLLEPTLDMLRTLHKHFGVSVLFCSATQPAFRKSGNLKQGFREDEITEVAPRVRELFTKLQRVTYRVEPETDRWDWNRVADRMLQQPQALCVVNLRQHAFDIFLALKERRMALHRQTWPQASTLGSEEPSFEHAVFHLSSAMCPAHRLDVLGLSKKPAANNIKRRLDRDNPQPCWVVSTQLIEAGVDIDFPVVLRAMGPLDSIVQAAGRCNREGRLKDENGHPRLGEMIVFHPVEAGLPRGIYEKGTSITPSYLADDRVRRGEHTIQELREKLNFRSVGERAKVIPDDTVPVVVPYREAAKLIKRIRAARRVDFRVLRRVQRYMVNLRRGAKTVFEQLHDAGRLQPLVPELDLLVVDTDCYDLQRGIVFRERPPEDFVQ